MRILNRLLRFFQNRHHYLKLHTKLIFILVLSVFLPLFFAEFLFTSNILRISSEVTTASIETAFNQAYYVLSGQTNSIRKSASLLLNDKYIIKYFRNPAGALDMSQQKAVKDLLANNINFIESSQNIQRLHMYINDDYKYIIDNIKYSGIGTLADTPWYISFCKATTRSAWLTSRDNASAPAQLYFRNAGNTLSYVIKAVDMGNYRNAMSIIKFDFLKSNVEEILQKSLVIDGSTTYIQTAQKEVVASASKNGPVMVAAEPVAHSSISTTIWDTISIDGTPCYRGVRSFEKNNWYLITIVPLDSISSMTKNSSQAFYFISLAFFIGVLMFISSLFFSNSITRRISIVANGMKSIKDGKLTSIPSSATRDEIGSLIDDYNYMANEMKLLIESTYLSGANLKSAELKALQAQINPHFLYNTLDLINSYSFSKEPEVVDRLIVSLTAFYKLSLNHGNDIYQIWQELQLVEAYCDIQKIRYPGSLSLRIDVPAGLLQYNLPKITFQPLIENSILHGILCKKSKSGTITITGSERDGMLLFGIHDDGVGMENALVEKLNALHFPGADMPGSHYGIQNINHRIQLYFGQTYPLTFESLPGEGTTVFLRFPAR